jgi:hypothetical protein
MSPKKTVKISGSDGEYTFHVHLVRRRIELILRKAFFTEAELIIGMNLVPDDVQIKFYKKLSQLCDEYKSTSPNPQ